MTLYEEVIYAKRVVAVMLVPLVSMLVGLYESYVTGEGPTFMLITTTFVFAVIFESMAFRVRIYEDRIVLSGFLDLFIRKTVKIDEIEWFAVGDNWVSCNTPLHFTLPGKACVYLKKAKGWDISFSTNRPEEVKKVLTSLSVLREA